MDYKDRLKEEYKQTKERYLKLIVMLLNVENGTNEYEFDYPIDVLTDQVYYMGEYLKCLEIRAYFDEIDLGY